MLIILIWLSDHMTILLILFNQIFNQIKNTLSYFN